MNNSPATILKQRSKHLGWTEAEIAEKSGVTQSTVHRILSGTSRDPRRSNVVKIAMAMGMQETDVYGGGSYAAEEPRGTFAVPKALSEGPVILGRVPLISWVQAGDFCEAVDLFEPGDAEDWIPCPAAHSDNSYALKISGSSMEPRFSEGEIIIVDPDKPADPGKFVIAKKAGDHTVTFKQLLVDGGTHYLKAINPRWPDPIIRMDEEWHICGVVICKVELFS